MQLTVFNGSPRGRKSNSKIILDQFLSGFETTPGNSYELHYLNRLKETEHFVQAFAEADTVLLTHPLYTDAMPAIVKAFHRSSWNQICGRGKQSNAWLHRPIWICGGNALTLCGAVLGRSFPGVWAVVILARSSRVAANRCTEGRNNSRKS